MKSFLRRVSGAMLFALGFAGGASAQAPAIKVEPVHLAGGARAYLYQPADDSATTAFILMHPAADFTRHYACEPLARLGFAVFCMGSRYLFNERFSIVEDLLIDLKQGVEFLRNAQARPRDMLLPHPAANRITKIVLIGNSGGGEIMAMYQAEAENNTITRTPAGDPVDLRGLPRIDGIILTAAHRGRAFVFTAEMDAAVIDENNPTLVDESLSLMNPANGFQNYQERKSSKYSPEFLRRYRQAQNDRNDRITFWAEARLAELKREQARLESTLGLKFQRPPDIQFAAPRTAADPRFYDMSLDPSDRIPGSGFGDGITVNYAPGSFGRVHSLRSWLSMFSRLRNNGGTEHHLARVGVPVMVMWPTADQLIFRQDSEDIFQAAQSEALPADKRNKELVHMERLNHFFAPIAPEFARLRPLMFAKKAAWTRACVEKDCGAGVRRTLINHEGKEGPLGPAALSDPLAREVNVLPPHKRPKAVYGEPK